MRTIAEVGDVVIVRAFGYHNKAGDAIASNGWFGGKKEEIFQPDLPKATRRAKVKITKAWEDEFGWRYRAVPENDSMLTEYLKQHAKEQIVYIGEFDIVN